MGRSPCCDESGLKKGPWTPEEDQKLVKFIQKNGHGSWRALPKLAGLNRCGKSCRLRWTNYLRPDIKRGKFSQEEEQTILNLHSILGNKWSAIATHLPGRTDNEIKNFWNTHLKKKLIQMGFDPMTHRPRTDIFSSLSNLIALANLKEIMEHNSWEEQAVRLQTEVAKLHYLQYLLQTPTSNYPMPNLDMDTLNLLNSLPSLNPGTNLDGLNPFDKIHDHLPDLQTLELPSNLSKENNINNMVISDQIIHPCEFSILSQGENNSPNTTSPWLPSLSSSPSPPPPPPPPQAATSTTTAATATLAAPPPVDGCSSSTNTFWPDLILEDSFFHEIGYSS